MFSPKRSSPSISSSASSRSGTSSISSSNSSATSAMSSLSSSLPVGEEGGTGVDVGAWPVWSRVRLRVGEDCCVSPSSLNVRGYHCLAVGAVMGRGADARGDASLLINSRLGATRQF